MTTWGEGERIDDACATAQVGDLVSLKNGTVGSALATLADGMDTGVPWDASLWGTLPVQQATSSVPVSDYGNVFTGPIPLFESDVNCTASGKWNESFTIVGFAWGVLYDVKSTGSNKTIWMRIDPDDVYHVGTMWGGTNYGVTTLTPVRAIDCPVVH
jgi:hypothetical protein